MARTDEARYRQGMTAEILNLRQARKARARTEAEAQAAANRAKFGRTKAERQRAQMDSARMEKHIDGAKRDSDAHDI